MSIQAPFDDSLQLEDIMPVDISDTQLIIDTESTDNNTNNTTSILPNQQVQEVDDVEIRSLDKNEVANNSGITKVTSYITVATLLFINLLNYMDRFTVAGVLKDVIKYYDLNHSQAGLIQTSFICSYMVFSPIFGLLGDRYTRKYIMAVGITMWSAVTLCSSYIPSDSFYGFVILRGLVGIGEASYSTIAPTIIADLFSKGMRTKMLMVFYFAIPVGSGLGYIVGSYVASLAGKWQFALRVTPGLGVICVILILVFCKEPPRGMADEGTHLSNTDVITDLKAIFRCKSFTLSTIGFTCVTYVTGALALWAPTFMLDSILYQNHPATEESVSLKFGLITVAAGFIGVAVGAEAGRRYKIYNPRSDPLVCAFGLLCCVPFLFFALVLSQCNTVLTWVLIFIGETFLCLNWALVADMLLYVIIPTRRSTAEAVQILVSHAFGDAGSPLLVGVFADQISSAYGPVAKSTPVQFKSLQYALYTTTFVCVLGGAFFLATALVIEQDKSRANKIIKGLSTSNSNESLPAILNAKTDDDANLIQA